MTTPPPKPPSLPTAPDGSHGAHRYLSALIAEQHAVTAATVALRTAPPGPLPASPPRVRLQLVPRPTSWRAEANCAGVDPELFYPKRGGSKDLQAEQIAAAKAVCEGCTVRPMCLVEALERNEEQGIWGGLSERERRVLARRLPRVARCSRCGGRFVKVASGQKFCGGRCPLLVRVGGRRRRVAS